MSTEKFNWNDILQNRSLFNEAAQKVMSTQEVAHICNNNNRNILKIVPKTQTTVPEATQFSLMDNTLSLESLFITAHQAGDAIGFRQPPSSETSVVVIPVAHPNYFDHNN